MADKVYKFHEVPKGERWQYFKDYYRTPVIILALVAIGLVSLIKTTVFAPREDVTILAVSEQYVDYTLWDAVTQAMETMPFDFDKDDKSLAEISYVYLNESDKKNNPEMYTASQTKLTASLYAAESALQIVDDSFYDVFLEEELLGTYAELPDAMGHGKEEIIKIPLKELTPFKDVPGLPEGLYMTLRPKAAMQLGKSEKKLAKYETQLQALLLMMQ